jgi:Spy/CpxP family protein refolding chaperone
MNQSLATPPRPTWRKRLLQGAIFSAVLATGVAAVQLLPMQSAFAAGGLAAMHGPGPGPFGADLRERHGAMMQEHVRLVLNDIGASDAQKAKIDGLLRQAMDDQHADMERAHADFRLLKDLLAAPTIDIAKVNTVRAEQDQLALQTSRRLTDTALAVAQQLTPAQRQKLGAHLDELFARHHGGPPPRD